MIKVRSLSPTGDFTWGRGKNNYLTGNAAISQNLQTRLNSFLADCFFAIQDGIDWFNLLGSKNFLGLRTVVEAKILNTEGITDLIALNISINSARSFSLSYEVNTIYTGVLGPTATVTGGGNYILTEGGAVITTEDGNPLTI